MNRELYNKLHNKLSKSNVIIDKLTNIIIKSISQFSTNIYKYTNPIDTINNSEIYFNNYDDFINYILGEACNKNNILAVNRTDNNSILYDIDFQPHNNWKEKHKYSLREWCDVMDIKANKYYSYTLSDFQIEQYVRYYFG